MTPGKAFRDALRPGQLVQIVGAVNAYTALLAQDAGFRVLYLSGAGVANASLGLPDLGMTNLNDVLTDARRITSVCPLPLLVDIDTGWGSSLTIARTIRECIAAGVAAVHIEDQVDAKRCGHREGKRLVSTEQMCSRIKAAVDARTDPSFVIMARCDAYASEGLSGLVERSQAYIGAGADMIFPEAMPSLSDYHHLSQCITTPFLANITEFGKTPLFSCEELIRAGVAMALYPLSAFRAMSLAAQNTYQAIAADGSQAAMLAAMQTRQELYRVLDYDAAEKQLDE